MRPTIAGLLLVAASSAAAQTSRPETPEIATSGHGEMVLPPDHAQLRLGIEIRAGSASDASAQVGARVQRARQAIATKGFVLDSVRVTGFDVSPNYQFDRERRLIDYSGRATIELTVRPLGRLATVMDTALVSGVNEITGIEFASDSAPAARDRALALALARARRDADALARAAGGQRGRLLTVTADPSPRPYDRAQGMALRAAVAGAPPVEREVIVSVSVQARWEFVPGTP